MKTSSIPIACKNLSFAFKNGYKANKNISFTINPGELMTLLGPNGAGKTTLVRQIYGELSPTEGTIEVFGKQPSSTPTIIQTKMGIVPQKIALFENLTVRDHLFSFARLKNLSRKDTKRAVLAITEKCELGKILNNKAKTLSGGQRRLTLLALAMITDPPILILDEPTVGLDPIVRQKVWNLLKKEVKNGKAILLTTHYLDEAEYLSNKLGFISEGVLQHLGPIEQFHSKFNNSFILKDNSKSHDRSEHVINNFSSLSEAHAAAKNANLSNYSIGPASLKDIYFQLMGETL